jgi:hypothetical protein
MPKTVLFISNKRRNSCTTWYTIWTYSFVTGILAVLWRLLVKLVLHDNHGSVLCDDDYSYIIKFKMWILVIFLCSGLTQFRSVTVEMREWRYCFKLSRKVLLHFGPNSTSFLEPLIETCVNCLECTTIQTTGGHVWWVSVLCCCVCCDVVSMKEKSTAFGNFRIDRCSFIICIFLLKMKEAVGGTYAWSYGLHSGGKYKSLKLQSDLCSGLTTIFICFDLGRS